MKYYHLTILHKGEYETLYVEVSSIESFIAIEKELGRIIHILYSREISAKEYQHAIDLSIHTISFS